MQPVSTKTTAGNRHKVGDSIKLCRFELMPPVIADKFKTALPDNKALNRQALNMWVPTLTTQRLETELNLIFCSVSWMSCQCCLSNVSQL